MATTPDDILAALLRLEAATTATGGATATLLQSMLHEITVVDSSIMDVTATIQQGKGGNTTATPPAPKPKGFFGTLWGKAKGALGNTRGGKAVGGVLGSLGKLGKSVGGLFGGGKGGAAAGGAGGAVATAAVELGKSLYEAGKAVKDFAYEQEAVARRLAQVSPSQAANLAQLDANRMIRDFETGEKTAGSGKKLTDAIDAWEEAIRPLEDAFQDFKNNVGAALLDALTMVATALNDLAKLMPGYEASQKIKAAEEFLKKMQMEQTGGLFGDFLSKAAEDQRKRAAVARERIAAMKQPPAK